MNDPISEIATKEAIAVAKGFLSEISKGSVAAVGGILADHVNYWRFKNKINLLLKTKEFLKKKAIRVEKILPDVFVPLLEDAANTEDEALSKMFASLLTSHLDPATQSQVHPSFAKILAQLSPLDARIITELYHGSLQSRGFGFASHKVCERFEVSEETVSIAFQNLWRLGICDHGSNLAAHLHLQKYVCFTDYGWLFAQACLSNS